ncbi:MAG: elongation factor P [Chitinophagales bacterium]
MATSNDIKNGLCIKFNHDIYSITDFQHVKPGKGPAFVRGKMKSLTTGKVIDNTWPAGHKIETVRVERHKFQYLYKDEIGMNFMNSETFEQVAVNPDIIDNWDLLKDGQEVEILFNTEDDSVLTCELPMHLILEVTQADPAVKGNTSTNAVKEVTLETGAKINAPLFINEGDKLKIDARARAYMERAK